MALPDDGSGDFDFEEGCLSLLDIFDPDLESFFALPVITGECFPDNVGGLKGLWTGMEKS